MSSGQLPLDESWLGCDHFGTGKVLFLVVLNSLPVLRKVIDCDNCVYYII